MTSSAFVRYGLQPTSINVDPVMLPTFLTSSQVFKVKDKDTVVLPCEVSNPEFKDRTKKQNALQKLADLFNTSTAEIQRKLHDLRTQVNQEWRKIQKRKSAWEFFDSLKFIIDANIQNATEDNLVPTANASQTEPQHSLIDRENVTQESPKIERNGSKRL
ncbi:unnamed protein product [Acanthoscelides obtectus]|uniref:MADF domain-containing protein n=1 Tax=Acanthoscelides obtectus TaxID=200917 RepID=A0A9P0JXA2_ACAOB|nr:unnamed protein product [Acanthoscelides obtectus]CAK1657138.1 hypothetical protein AOBTE_LOCUS20143 [Acanthoscelides obtectus]